MHRRAGRRDRHARRRSPRSPSAPCAARSLSSRRCASAWRCSRVFGGRRRARCLRSGSTIMPGATVLVATMRAAGAHTALVSGGFTAFVEPVGRKIGFRRDARQRRSSARPAPSPASCAEPILGARGKGAGAAGASPRGSASTLEETLAVGDGANDVGMISRPGSASPIAPSRRSAPWRTRRSTMPT